MKHLKSSIKKVIVTFLALICTLNVIPAFVNVSAAIPSISTSRYIKGYVLSNYNNTYVYTDSSLTTRGTSNPYRRYSSATVYANDEIYIYSMNNTYCYISYPTSSGRKYGYIRTSSVTSNNYSQNATTCRANITTYKKAGGSRYGSISKGDTVYTLASSGNYIQIVYPVNGGYKLGWVTGSDYNNYIKPAENRPISDGTYYICSASNNKMVLDVSGCSTYNCAQVILHQNNGGKNQQVEIKYAGNGYYTIKFVHSGKYLDVYRGSAANGTALIQYNYTGGSNQLWSINKNSDGSYSIKSKIGNYCVDVYGARFVDSQKMNIWQNNGTIAQKFYFQSVSNVSGTSDTKFENPMNNMYCTWSTKTNMSWGQKIYANATGRVYHIGIDVYGTGGLVNATANGKVVATGYNGANGNYIIIQHTISGKTVYSFYAHLRNIYVKNGQTVAVGQNIAVAGNTGSSTTATHLHFAIVDKLWSNGGYYGYATSFSGNKVTYGGVTYYNPSYVISYDKLP